MSSENHKIWKSCLIGLPNLFIEKIKCVGFLDELLCAHQENGRSSLRAKFEGWENRLHMPIKNMTLTGVNAIPYGKRLFIIDQHIQNPKSSNPTKLETTLQTLWKKPRNPPTKLEEEFAPENILIGMELASIGHLTVQICQFWINSWTNESKNTCMMMVASIHLPNLNNASILRSRKSPKRKSQTP